MSIDTVLFMISLATLGSVSLNFYQAVVARRARKAVTLPVVAPAPVKAAVAVPVAAVPSAAPISALSAAAGVAQCATCGRNVARYTITSKGPVCANCLPLK